MADNLDFIDDAKKLIRRHVNQSCTTTLDAWVILEDISILWVVRNYSSGWQVVASVARLDNKLYQASYNENTGETLVRTYFVYKDEVYLESENELEQEQARSHLRQG